MAAKKRPQKNLATPAQTDLFHKGKLVEELDSYKRYGEQLHIKLQEVNSRFDELKRQAEENSEQALAKQAETKSIFQKIIDSLTESRDSLRGKLANMTAQRNRLLEAQKRNTEKLLEAKEQLDIMQEDFDQDMAELADAYQDIPLESRHLLPQKLKDLLDKIEEDYINEKEV